ncbi:MAG: hypothetical protein ACRC4M_05535 [Mycoplasma sp.]
MLTMFINGKQNIKINALRTYLLEIVDDEKTGKNKKTGKTRSKTIAIAWNIKKKSIYTPRIIINISL